MGWNLQLEPAPVQLHPSVQGAASSQQQLFLAWMQSMGRRQVGFSGFFGVEKKRRLNRVIQHERKYVHMCISWACFFWYQFVLVGSCKFTWGTIDFSRSETFAVDLLGIFVQALDTYNRVWSKKSWCDAVIRWEYSKYFVKLGLGVNFSYYKL